MNGWDEATREEKVLSGIFFRSPRWLRAAMWVTVRLPDPLGYSFDALERYRNERGLREWRVKRVHWS